MSALHLTIQTLAVLVENLPVGTNLALLHFLWMLVSGHLLTSRGALFPALQASGLAEDAVRRAWAAFRYGVWSIATLLRIWQGYIEGLESKHYYAPAGKALPAVLIGLVGMTGNLNGQRLAVPREILRVSADDPSEAGLKRALLQKVARKRAADEVAVLDAGFRLREVQAAGVQGYVVRLPKNFTAQRNIVAKKFKDYGAVGISFVCQQVEREGPYYDLFPLDQKIQQVRLKWQKMDTKHKIVVVAYAVVVLLVVGGMLLPK